MTLRLTIHRSAAEIGGNCIELESAGVRLLLDVGRPLAADPEASVDALLPESLDRERPCAGVILSHPHRDHWGLASGLPAGWPIWCGAAAERLIRITAGFARETLDRTLSTYRSGEAFAVGPFRIEPILVDHSAFDAHMLLIEAGGRRVLYTGDFRRHGRKSVLTERLMRHPPADVDALLMEGTNLGRDAAPESEDALEKHFAALFARTRGRVFVGWSAQNIDRTVTLYRACKRTRRTLVIDLYTAEVLHALREFARLPQPGWENLKVVLTAGLRRRYGGAEKERFVADICVPNGMSARALAADRHKWVVMIRPSLIRDFERKGVAPDTDDAWSFSQWRGYLREGDGKRLHEWFAAAGTPAEHIHTSGHAGRDDLLAFAKAIAPKRLVPIHSFDWDERAEGFADLVRARDGETIEL